MLFTKNVDRSSLSSVVIPTSCALFFSESDGNGGVQISAKLPSGNFVVVGGGSASPFPVGTVMAFAGAGTIPAGWLLCDGSAVDRVTYSELFAVIGDTYRPKDEVEYDDTKFYIPDFRGAFLRGYDGRDDSETEDIGTKQAEELPNITGSIPGGVVGQNPDYWKAVTGAFHAPAEHTGDVLSLDSAGGGRDPILFDASKCNPIYKSSGHVTPVNYAVQYIIKY